MATDRRLHPENPESPAVTARTADPFAVSC
jgi:hypothetical protein